MPKQICNPVTFIIRVEFDGGTPSVEDTRVDYGVSYSEYPSDGVRQKSCDVSLEPAQETAILNFMKDVVKPQVETTEGISA